VTEDRRARIRIRDVYREMLATLRLHPGLLFAAALAVFVPLGLLDAVDEVLASLDPDELDDLATSALVAEIVLHNAIALVGDVFFAGVVAAVVSEEHGAVHRSLRRLARSLPWRRLIAIDLLFTLSISIGLLLLVVPGVVLATWFALAAPAAKLEDRRVIDSFRRSRALVRGRFWMVFWAVIPLTIAGYALAIGAAAGGYWALGENFVGDWVGAVIGDVVISGPYALAVVVLFYALRDRRPAPAEPAAEPG